MFIKKTYISICGALLATIISTAQTTINSVIKSKDHQEELLGATITNLTTKKSVFSNHKGAFSIDVIDLTEKLKITYLGFESITLSANKISDVVYLNASLESLHQVILSASRTKEKKHNVPVAISVVSKKTLAQMQPNDISEVLNQKPGVLMVDLGNEQHMMAIRQPISTKSVFLYLEDGLPIRPTGIFNHNALLEMNANALENIEIIRGAYSSLYGSEAIGGAVNFITEKPNKELSIDLAARVNNIGYKRFDAKISTTIGKTGFYLSTYKSSVYDGFREYGNFDKSAITAKATHQFSKKFNLEGALTYVDYFSEMSGSIKKTAFKVKDFSSIHSFTFRDAEALRVTSTLNYDWNNDNSSFLKLFYRNNSMAQNPTYRIGFNKQDGLIHGELNSNNFESFGILGQHNTTFSEEFKFSIGGIVDFTNNNFIAEDLIVTQNANNIYESYVQTENFKSDYNAKLLNTGVFSTAEYRLNDLFRLNGGLRLDAFNYKFDNNLGVSASAFSSPNTTNTFWSFTPRLGLVYNNNKHGAYVNYSRGFVPPSVGELYKGKAVPDLNPSIFNNFEIGSFVSLLKSKLYFDAALYYLRGENEVISVTQDNGTRVNDNAGETAHYGVEFLMEYAINSEFKLTVSEAFSKHKFVNYVEKGKDYSGNEMSGAPQYNGSTQVTYKPNYVKGLNIGIELQTLGAYFTDNKNTIQYDGHELLNLRTGYQLKQFYIWANVLNITDKLYANRASTGFGRTTFSPGNPRNVTVGIRYSLK